MLDDGVALLHAGGWSAAAEMFRLVNHSDVDCMLSWWGAAMAAWGAWRDGAGDEMLTRGESAITSGRLSRRGTTRERRYLDAAALLFDGQRRDDLAAVSGRYAVAMETLSADHPLDDNAALVAALALAERADDSENATEANRLAAVAALSRLGRDLKHPAVTRALLVAARHPSAAPRAMSAADAVLGEPAAPLELLKAAADLFVAAGRWDRAEVALARVADAARGRGALVEEARALDGQSYVLLQMGRPRAAAALVNRMARMSEALLPGAGPEFHGVRAAAEAAAARIVRERLERDGPSRAGAVPGDDRLAARALAAARAGRLTAALDMLRPSIARETAALQQRPTVPIGPPVAELSAELVLRFGPPLEALGQFEVVLRRWPGRLRALDGAAQAAERAGRGDRAQDFTRQIVLHTARAEVPPPPIVARARARQPIGAEPRAGMTPPGPPSGGRRLAARRFVR